MAKAQLVYINRSVGTGTGGAPASVYDSQVITEGTISAPADSRFKTALIIPIEEDIYLAIGQIPDVEVPAQQILVPLGHTYEVAVGLGLRFAIKASGTNASGGGEGGGGEGGVSDVIKIDETQNTVKVDSDTPVNVSGPLTNTQLRATALPVSGTVGVSGSVAVTGPVTDSQLRATALPVSGPLTDAQLRATALPVSGTVGVSGSVAVTGPATGAQLTAAVTAGNTLKAPINRSGSITDGGTSQTLAVSNASRGHLFIQNISSEDIWISEFGAAEIEGSGSYRIAPGLDTRVLSNAAVTVIAATTGTKFTATEINA